MKIKIITCHDVYNYGASLQAYALQTYLIAKEGYDVEIIDYKPDYLRVHYKFWYVPRSSRYYALAKKNVLFRFLLCCYFAPKRFATYGRKRKFDAFTRQYLHLTRRYNSYQELVSDPPAADVYIAGSDQIWNCALPNGKDPAYFLQFGGKDIRRISYAASFAISDVPKEYQLQMQSWLHSFSAISVREKTGLAILEVLKFTGCNVVDPVFLIPSQTWSLLSEQVIMRKRGYVLVYDLYKDSRIKSEAERLSVLTGLDIVVVDGLMKCSYGREHIVNAGPVEFVSLIKHADFVISNSFHATAFAIIFNRPFSVYYGLHGGSRMSDLLDVLDLSSQFNTDVPRYDFDWNKINAIIEMLRSESIRFLADNL